MRLLSVSGDLGKLVECLWSFEVEDNDLPLRHQQLRRRRIGTEKGEAFLWWPSLLLYMVLWGGEGDRECCRLVVAVIYRVPVSVSERGRERS